MADISQSIEDLRTQMQEFKIPELSSQITRLGKDLGSFKENNTGRETLVDDQIRTF